ncbi:AraC family transcriptional regulator [Cohnella silvisoli]|uniref:AraC family transcriptional regulator n=1 Tax=Cohnella silvisoli TaxID=2873699 RepID=A0ABV1L224_9BACL|nr:AraC family transcriptional regulator [Cohnella silvisoli]MCD9025111.1 AraC family transcriptional regulator [Cohnella silvisoli]
MNRLKLKQTYIRVFLFLSILFTLAFVPYTLFLSAKFTTYAQEEINTNAGARFDQTLKGTEFALNRLKSYALSIYETPAVREWLISDTKNPLSAMIASNGMATLLANEPFIYKTYLINTNTQEVIDSSVGIRAADQFEDQRMLTNVRDDRPRVLRFFNHEIGGQKFMCLVVPSTPIHNAYNGYLVMLLDNRLFQNTILQSSIQTGIEVAITDDQGNVVTASPGAEALVQAAFQNRVAGEMFKIVDGGEEWSVIERNMESQPWTMFYLTRLGIAKEKIITFQRQILVTSFTVLLMLFILLYWISRRSYRPLSQLAARIRHEFAKARMKQAPDFSANSGEYSVIQKGMDALFDTVDNMVFSMRNHQEVIDGEYMRQWILIGAMSEPIRVYVESHFRLLSYEQMRMIVLRIDQYAAFTEKYSNFGSRKLLKYGISNIAKEIVTEQGWTAESVDFGGDHVVFLVGHKGRENDSWLNVLGQIAEQIETWLNIHIVIGMSESFEQEGDLRTIYDHTYELTHLKFITGEGNVFQEKDYKRYADIVKHSGDEKLVESLIQNVRLGQQDKAIAILDVLISQMKSMSRAECIFELTILFHNLMKALKPFVFFDHSVGIQKFLERFRTLDEVRDWLSEKLGDIILNMWQRRNAGRKETLAVEVRDYINNRIHDPMLSAEEIGSYLNLSTSYVRQVFKDVTGVTLLDYIIETRIENVKRLLESTNWSIADIAESSGFQTKSHFYTTFKKMTGRTPNEHRQFHMSGIER